VSDERSVVVVGAGLGGLRVCEGRRRLGFDGSLTLVGAEDEHPYDRPPLSKEVLKGTRPNPPVLRGVDELAELGLDLRIASTALELDSVAQQVRLADGEVIGYDVLVVATGARPRPWAMGGGAANVWTLRTAEDAAGIAAVIAERGRLAVLGAGFIGCEVAASAREMGCEVTLLEMLPTPLSRVIGVEAGEEIARRHRAAGVDLRCGVTIEEVVVEAGRVTAIRLPDGAVIEVDGLVAGLGVVPNVEWVGSSGLLVDDGIVCNAVGETSHESVYALGDVARWVNVTSGRHRRVEHWTTTSEQASIVAAQIADGTHERRPLDEVPYFWSDQYGTKIQCLGEPSGTADVTVVHTGPNGDRPLFVYSRAGLMVGVLGFGLARVVMRLRPLLAERAPVERALKIAAELHPVVPA